MWSLRLTLARLRPWNAATITRTLIVAAAVAAFLGGDYALFRRLFRAVAGVESESPLFALGLLRNLLSLVFLTASVVLFSSSLTAAIGSFFADLDLDTYHAAPRSRLRIAIARWGKTLAQSAAIIFLFLVPLFVAFSQQYPTSVARQGAVIVNLAVLLTIPVSLASIVILLLVRWFPVNRVHQIVAALAVLVLTVVVIAFRMSRPERFFSDISTDDVSRVLQSIELPAMSIYPSSALAELMTRADAPLLMPRILVTALALFVVFMLVAKRWYFAAFVRARESMAPAAIAAAPATRLLDRMLARTDPPLRALAGKEIRTITRDVAQWSQVFLMAALLFLYLYNIRLLPLGGDARATLVAYANVGMAGFVIAAICLRFAYPSVSAEGKAFWLIRTSPISYRQFLLVKVFVYAAPLTLLALLLTSIANLMLGANSIVWFTTMVGSSILAVTLVSLGVGLGALAPDFNAENPLQVGLSLGGFAYMAIAMAYVGIVMVLMARPVTNYFLTRVLRVTDGSDAIALTLPIVTALTLSILLAVIPMRLATHRLSRMSESD